VQQSEEQKQERRRQIASREKQRIDQETEDERRERLAKKASREKQRRDQETDDERLERQVKDVSRAKRRREQETDDERLERQMKKALHQRRRRQRSSSLYAAALRDEFPHESYHGRMDNVCQHCNALHFKGECTSDRNDEFKQCCHYGSVQLPDLLPYPDEIKALLQGTDLESRNFRENIRSYNSALAFASMGAQIDLPQGFGPYCFRIHEQIYHRIGSLHPDPGQRAQFGLLYILDSSLTLKERIENAANENCNETTMRKLGDIIKNISPFAAAFKMMHEVEQEEIDRAKREKRDLWPTHFYRKCSNSMQQNNSLSRK
jgi:flagellar biosynthesis GTPase FlhF